MKPKENKTYNLLKFGTLLFGIALLFYGCDTKDTIDVPLEEQFQGELVEKVSFEEIKNDPLFSKAICDFKLDDLEENLYDKSSYSSDLFIDLNSINKIEKDHATTYTFLVEDSTQELPPFAFKNLVIEITSEKTQGYFITYYPTNEYIQNRINNIETDFIANVAVSEVKDDIVQLLNQIQSNKTSSDCIKYIVIETVCASGQHWPGDYCSLSGSDRAQTYYLAVLDEGCYNSGGGDDMGGVPISIGDDQNISIPSGGDSSGTNDTPSVSTGSTYPNEPSGIGNLNTSDIENLLSYKPSVIENKTNYFNYLKNVSNYCNAAGQFEIGSMLYNYGINSNLSNQELVVVSSKAKEILGVLAKNNFTDINQYTLADQKIIAQNTLFVFFLPDIKDLGIDIPKTAEEWKVFFEIMKPILLEIGIEFVPLGGVYNSAVDALNGIDKGDWTQITLGVVGIIVEFTPADQIKNLFKLVKSSKKGFKIFKLTRKFTNMIKNALESGLKIVLDNDIVKFLDDAGAEIARIVNNVMTFKYSGYGGDIITNPDKTTTILGRYIDNTGNGTKSILDSGLFKYGENKEGLNLLNDPNWNNLTQSQRDNLNKNWLEQAFQRGDDIRLVSNPANNKFSNGVLTQYGKELNWINEFLGSYNYSFNSITQTYIKN